MLQHYLLDTNTVSDIIKGRSAQAIAHFKATLPSSRLYVSVITKAELSFGFAKRPQATRLRSAFDTFTQVVETVAWDEAAASAYATLRLELLHRTLALATMDMLIAAHAHALSATLGTSDKAFQQLGGLIDITNWSEDIRTSKP